MNFPVDNEAMQKLMEALPPTEGPLLMCAICSAPIPPGWPVVWTDAGYAHRFKTQCQTWHADVAGYPSLGDPSD